MRGFAVMGPDSVSSAPFLQGGGEVRLMPGPEPSPHHHAVGSVLPYSPLSALKLFRGSQ